MPSRWAHGVRMCLATAPCPTCAAPFLTERILRGGRQIKTCVRPGCDYKQEAETTVA